MQRKTTTGAATAAASEARPNARSSDIETMPISVGNTKKTMSAFTVIPIVWKFYKTNGMSAATRRR